MAILSLSQYQTGGQKKTSFLNDDEEITPIKQKQPLLQGLLSGDNTDTGPAVTSDNIKSVEAMMKTSTDSLNDSFKKESNFSNVAGKTMGAVGAAAGFATEAVALNSSVAASDKEANARTMKLAMSGMTAGATIGSVIPGVGTAIGAAAGAVIGGTVGMLKKVPDRKKRLEASNESYNSKLFSMTAQTNQMAENARLQEEMEHQQNMVKAQMGLLNLKY